MVIFKSNGKCFVKLYNSSFFIYLKNYQNNNNNNNNITKIYNNKISILITLNVQFKCTNVQHWTNLN
ncbi:hypothetical protein ACMBCM_05115 [Spiroplasma sp. K1]